MLVTWCYTWTHLCKERNTTE